MNKSAVQLEWFVYIPSGECVRAINVHRAIDMLKPFYRGHHVTTANVVLEEEYNRRLEAGELVDI